MRGGQLQMGLIFAYRPARLPGPPIYSRWEIYHMKKLAACYNECPL